MAKITSKGQLSGIVGNLSFRVLNGQPVVQTKPGKGRVTQSDNTKSSASEFGLASSVAMKIRSALFPIIRGYADRGMHLRFNTIIREAIASNTSLPVGTRTL